MASAKLQAATRTELEDMDMDISSMIDLVFLLLIFFMVASHLIIIQIDEEVRPPVATAGKAVENAMGRIVVNIRADGSVYDTVPRLMSGPDGDMGEVQAYIGELADSYNQTNQKPKLHLRADKDVDVKRIKEVVKAASLANVIDVIFAAYVSEGAASMAESDR